MVPSEVSTVGWLRPSVLTMPNGPNETSPDLAPAERSTSMSFQFLLALAAVAAFGVVAALRLIRSRAGRESPAGWLRLGMLAVFLLVPPLVLEALVAPKSGAGASDPIGAVALYFVAAAAVWFIAWIAALVAARVAPVAYRQTVVLVLTGRDTSGIVPFDPPMTRALAADVDRVEALNAAFPRGPAFLDQSSMPSFRPTWDALDGATRNLETRIAEQRRLHLGVAEKATETATDARSRLIALRQAAALSGQAWAA